jgi:Alpha/beta hydrolase family
MPSIRQNSAVVSALVGAAGRRPGAGAGEGRKPGDVAPGGWCPGALACGAMLVAAANGIQIGYTDSGGQGAVVVFSHGFLLDHTMFGRQVTALAPQYRVITWDQRGHGGTRATGPFTYWDSAADLLGLLDQLGVERAVLGGMSQGGFVSLRTCCMTGGRRRRRCRSPAGSIATGCPPRRTAGCARTRRGTSRRRPSGACGSSHGR